MGDMISAIRDELSALLNSVPMSTDSMEGWLVILCAGFMAYNIGKKAIEFVSWSVSAIFLVQVCYWLSFTGLNDVIPFSNLFKYDVLTSIAQCCVGTKLCDGILYVNAAIQAICIQTYNIVAGIFDHIDLSQWKFDHLFSIFNDIAGWL